MRIAVCDDEIDITTQMKHIIDEYVLEKNEMATVEVYQCGKAFLEAGQSFDVIFMDIDMNEKNDANGITIAKEIRETDKHVKIIFVTNYTDYQNYAFSVHAFAYLVKPISREQIYHVLNEVIEYSRTDLTSPYLHISTTDGCKKILVEDIYYFEYHNRQVKMVTKQETYFLKQTLSQIECMLGSYGFTMPHKSFIVNLMQVKCINGYTILMSDGSDVPLSQKKSVGFRKQLNRFIEKQITK
ncbi:MAG TPA: LytTR family DNA-binding domain-containing protein [Oscillospiraceae bacterium]|nr:LytTR family DNA-binding domain-containing protein [Oscillospiraceae bacterium]